MSKTSCLDTPELKMATVMILTLPKYVNNIFGKFFIKKMVCIFALLVTLATSTTATTTNNGHGNIIEISPLTAQGVATAFSISSTTPSPSIFAWGHITKYSSILFDEDIFIKAFITVDIKYSSDDVTNDFTIIGIYASNKLDSTSVPNTLSNDLTIYPIEGGVGYNYTTVRFVSRSYTEFQYNLIIHGINV